MSTAILELPTSRSTLAKDQKAVREAKEVIAGDRVIPAMEIPAEIDDYIAKLLGCDPKTRWPLRQKLALDLKYNGQSVLCHEAAGGQLNVLAVGSRLVSVVMGELDDNELAQVVVHHAETV
jgi:hypothetical protein